MVSGVLLLIFERAGWSSATAKVSDDRPQGQYAPAKTASASAAIELHESAQPLLKPSPVEPGARKSAL
jgi:hypothetical protein